MIGVDVLTQERDLGGAVRDHPPCLVQDGAGLGVAHRSVDSIYQGNLAAFCLGPGSRLVTKPLQHVGRRANKDQPGLFACAGKTGVFRQESVARMDRLAAMGLCDLYQLRSIQVSLYAMAR